MLSWLERRLGTHIGRLGWKSLRAQFEVGHWYTRSVLEALSALGAVFLGERTVDAHTLARMWSKVADWLMLGGVLVVPLAAICATIGALVPGNTELHRHTGSIFAFAILWFVAALLAAQFQRRRANDRATD